MWKLWLVGMVLLLGWWGYRWTVDQRVVPSELRTDQLAVEVLRVKSEMASETERIEVPDEVWRELLTETEYDFTVKMKTEPAFKNEYWDLKAEGIYVTTGCGQAVFSSREKYDSGTGWPSFWQPIGENVVREEVDYRYGMKRTLVKGARCDEYLGHVFEDGPEPTGLRYCLNSGALQFIPKEELETRGYGEYVGLFQ